MAFKTKLFEAIRHADLTHCNGQPVKARHLDDGPAGLLDPYVELADDTTIWLRDAEVEIDDAGRAYSRALDRSRGGTAEGEALVWHFMKLSPLRLSDLPETPLTVDDVRKALRVPPRAPARSRV